MYHDRTAPLPDDQVLKNLEVLHLAYNGIANLLPLQLGRIPSLKALFLQGLNSQVLCSCLFTGHQNWCATDVFSYRK